MNGELHSVFHCTTGYVCVLGSANDISLVVIRFRVKSDPGTSDSLCAISKVLELKKDRL